MDTWISIETEQPPENKQVLAYTDEGKMKVVVRRNKKFDTYMTVTHWMELPSKPIMKKADEMDVPKKRGRRKKEK